MAESSTPHVQGSSQSIAVGQKRETAPNGETKAVLLATVVFQQKKQVQAPLSSGAQPPVKRAKEAHNQQ